MDEPVGLGRIPSEEHLLTCVEREVASQQSSRVPAKNSAGALRSSLFGELAMLVAGVAALTAPLVYLAARIWPQDVAFLTSIAPHVF